VLENFDNISFSILPGFDLDQLASWLEKERPDNLAAAKLRHTHTKIAQYTAIPVGNTPPTLDVRIFAPITA